MPTGKKPCCLIIAPTDKRLPTVKMRCRRFCIENPVYRARVREELSRLDDDHARRAARQPLAFARRQRLGGEIYSAMVEYCLCLWGRYIILPKLLRMELEASALQVAEKMVFYSAFKPRRGSVLSR